MNAINLRGAYAGFVTRAAALIIDIVAISLSVAMLNWLFRTLLGFVNLDPGACPAAEAVFFQSEVCKISSRLMLVFSGAFPFLYLLFFWTLGGQTPGKYLLGLRVVRRDGGRVSFGQAVRRLVGYWASILTFGYGFFRVLTDDRRRGMHDRIAGTCVIYDWDARQDAGMIERIYGQLAELRQRGAFLRSGRLPVLPQDGPAPPETDSSPSSGLPGRNMSGEEGAGG